MPAEPPAKRAVAFVDGQNLFHATKKAFWADGAEWIKIDRTTFDACLDPNDYRPRKPSGP